MPDFQRDFYTWHDSWETYMQVRKQQLELDMEKKKKKELDMEQQPGSK